MLTEKDRFFAGVAVQKRYLNVEKLSKIFADFESQSQDSNFIQYLLRNHYLKPKHIREIALELQNQKKNFPKEKIVRKDNALDDTIALSFGSEKSLEVGSSFSHYIIKKELGRGAMGVVYKAYDTKLERDVALKVLPKRSSGNKEIQELFKEAKAAAQLDHSNIVSVYEFGESPQHYFTMEYVEGETLLDYIRKKKVKHRKLIQIFRNIAAGLHYAHKKGILHRDIKSSNVMLTPGGFPKIMDFGLAKPVDFDFEQSKEVEGTPSYMAPEQANGKDCDQRSDVYSLGATFYEALTGRVPFQGNSFNVLFQLLKKDPVSPRLLNPDIPIDLEAICLKCLEKRPEYRYSSALLFQQDLKNFQEGRPILAKPATSWTRFCKFVSRNVLLCATVTSFIFVAIFSIIFYVAQKENMLAKLRIEKQNAIQAKTQAKKAEKDARKSEENAKRALKEAEIAKRRIEDEKKASLQGNRKILEILKEMFLKYPEIRRNAKFLEGLRVIFMELQRLGLLKKLRKQGKDESSILTLKAIVFQDKESMGSYQKIIDKNPNSPLAYWRRGLIFYYQQKWEKALKDFQKLTLLDPRNAKIYITQAQIYLRLKNYKLAEKNFIKAVKENPKEPKYIEDCVDFYSNQKKYKKAVGFLTKLMQKHLSAYTYLNRAKMYFHLKEYKKGNEDLREFLKLKPKNHYAHYLMCRNFMALKNWENAHKSIVRSWKIAPKNPLYIVIRGQMLGKLGRDKEAEKVLKNAIKIAPNYTIPHQSLAYIYWKKNPKKAIRFLLNMSEKYPNDPDIFYNISCLYAKSKKKKSALRYLRYSLVKGFKNLEHIRKDSDLKCIHKDKRFKRLLKIFTIPNNQ